MEEVWKNVIGYETLYEVSNLGRVRSKERYVRYTKWKTGNYMQLRKSKLLSLTKMKNGYLRVELSDNGTHRLVLVHRLVAKAFIPNPNNYNQVNHIDGNKENNNVNNLEWCSCEMNMQHAQRNNLYRNHKEILQIKNGVVIKEFRSAYDIQKELGYFAQSIGKVALGKRKSAYGFQWAFKEKD